MAELSSIPWGLDAPLRQYLEQRDNGGPTVMPADLAATTAVVGATDVDTLEWSMESAPPLTGRGADGFALWWANSDTDDPLDGGVILHPDARRFSMTWDAAAVRSYAIQAVRFTHDGPQSGPKIQVDDWRGVS